jgi:hypothetical protein
MDSIVSASRWRGQTILSWAILQWHLIDGIAATVISRTVPKARNWRSFFGPHCGEILSQILKLFLVSVKQRPILSSCELYAVSIAAR